MNIKQPEAKTDGMPTWATINDNWMPVGRVAAPLPSGIYNVVETREGYAYKARTLQTDELIRFKGTICDTLLTEIDNFWQIADKFAKINMLHRRGYLLYGPPGSGKTALMEQIIENIIANDGVAFLCNDSPETLSEGLLEFRKREPKRRVVCVFEDLDSIIDAYGESDLLAYLDGENQSNHVINLATTNYPEKLNKRIINRPRRFDRVEKIGFPDASLRTEYFIRKLNIEQNEVKKWVQRSKGFSFSACADLVISVKCFDYPLMESAKRIATLLKEEIKSGDKFDDGD